MLRVWQVERATSLSCLPARFHMPVELSLSLSLAGRQAGRQEVHEDIKNDKWIELMWMNGEWGVWKSKSKIATCHHCLSKHAVFVKFEATVEIDLKGEFAFAPHSASFVRQGGKASLKGQTCSVVRFTSLYFRAILGLAAGRPRNEIFGGAKSGANQSASATRITDTDVQIWAHSSKTGQVRGCYCCRLETFTHFSSRNKLFFARLVNYISIKRRADACASDCKTVRSDRWKVSNVWLAKRVDGFYPLTWIARYGEQHAPFALRKK